MTITTLTSKGQITLAKPVREALHLKPSDRLRIEVSGEVAILHPLRQSLLDLGGSVSLKRKGKNKNAEAYAKRKAAEDIRHEGLP